MVPRRCRLLFPKLLTDRHDHAAQSQQSQGVGNHHQAVKEVSQLPDQIHLQRGTHNDEACHNHGVDLAGLLSKEIPHIDLAEEMPAQDRGEGEEKQADRHENISKAAEIADKGFLGQGDSVLPG